MIKRLSSPSYAKVAELVDALDSGSSGQYACGGSSPPFRMVLVLAITLASLVGCSVPGLDAVEELANHYNQASELVLSHQDNPAEALRALANYQKEHARKLNDLTQKCRELRQSLSYAQKRELRNHWQAKVEPAMNRLKRLKKGIEAPARAPE